MRIVFMGTPVFAVASLEKILDAGYQVVGVVTAPDRPAGRGQQLKASPVKVFAKTRNIPVLQPAKLRDPDFLKELELLKPDIAVVVAFRMLPEVVWSIPSRGTFNLHASLLPDYRGAAPINWVLINGERKSGVTTFMIDHKIDTGELLLQDEVMVPEEWTAGDLHDHLMEVGGKLVVKTLDGLSDQSLIPKVQDHSQFKHPAPKIFKEHCRIDWTKPAKALYNFIRGLSPYPAAWTTLSGKMLKVYHSEIGSACEEPVGTMKVDTTNRQLLIATADRWLAIKELQLEGKKRMPVKDFLSGYKGSLDRLE